MNQPFRDSRGALRGPARRVQPAAPVRPLETAEATAGGVPSIDEWAFVTTDRLTRDAAALASRVPADVDMVAAVPRSGLVPGSIIATRLHVPLVSCSRQQGVTEVGSGVRLEAAPGVGRRAPRHVLLVDDTAARGREMASNTAAVREAWPNARVTRCVVYCHPQARRAVDLCAALYDGAHYLEWNWQNAGHGAACGYDFDGILCSEDGQAAPLYLPRRAPVSLVVTGRHESARRHTLDWLDQWRVRVERLVMRDFDAPDHYDLARIAAMKAEHYGRSDCVLFAESDPWQAERIRDLTGRPVLCPAAGRVFPPRTAAPALPGVTTQLGNAAAAALRTARRALSGRDVLASPDEQARRAAVCASCEHWRPSDARCSKCGCRTRAKLALAAESCPDGRWGPT